ncbi:saccharopine dehydrogenase [Tieghemostelium lacteum]|uniref:Saccharopine dehydrogenase n=1 Tax=Tieghemostelium lacteum TaxID=361077 RepID=A0A152A2F5_TIELA|nr:saccharopine dehydrogenase [Tieghemostelium lacteum]|eukprot:KYR00433.1 saccharopine dehydrogenase [Tieghemostelium lacteum]
MGKKHNKRHQKKALIRVTESDNIDKSFEPELQQQDKFEKTEQKKEEEEEQKEQQQQPEQQQQEQEKEEEEKEETKLQENEPIKIDDGWDDNDIVFEKKQTKTKTAETNNDWNEPDIIIEDKPVLPVTEKPKKTKGKKIIKKIIRKPVPKTPKSPPQATPQATPVTQTPQTSGWGWFSSISSAVTSTINSIARLDEDEEEDFIEEEIEVEVSDSDSDEENMIDTEKKKQDIISDNDNDEPETIMNAIDNGVFKTADIIADSLYFAGSFLSSGFKTVQEQANIENVKGLAQGVAHISKETGKKATQSEMYEKGQKIATSMVDTSVDVLEQVGQKAYSIFSSQIKSNKNHNNDIPTTTTTTTSTTATSTPTSPTISTNNNNNIDENQTSPKTTNSKATSLTSSVNSSGGNIKRFILPGDLQVFDDGQFESNQATEHFKIHLYVQEIEKLSVESTMKIHQLNRKIQNTTIQTQVNTDQSEIKEILEGDSDIESRLSGLSLKSIYFNNDSLELQQDYNDYFEKLQEYLPTLKSKSTENILCRGLENIYQLLAISLQLISIISHSLIDGRLQQQDNNSSESIKEYSNRRSIEVVFLLTKYKQDISSLSNILLELLKSKQNPNSRKLINTLNIETNNAISHIDDSKTSIIPICQLSYLNEIKIPKKNNQKQ